MISDGDLSLFVLIIQIDSFRICFAIVLYLVWGGGGQVVVFDKNYEFWLSCCGHMMEWERRGETGREHLGCLSFNFVAWGRQGSFR